MDYNSRVVFQKQNILKQNFYLIYPHVIEKKKLFMIRVGCLVSLDAIRTSTFIIYKLTLMLKNLHILSRDHTAARKRKLQIKAMSVQAELTFILCNC